MKKNKKFLGEFLIEEGLLSQNQLKAALEEQEKTGKLLGEILIKQKIVNEETLTRSLSCLLDLDYLDPLSLAIPPQIISLIPENLAREFKLIPVEKKDNKLIVAMINPQDVFALDEVRAITQIPLDPRISTASSINKALDKHYGQRSELKNIVTAVTQKEIGQKSTGAEAAKLKEELGESGPATKLIDQLTYDAVKDGASDIHIEPQENKVIVRFRVDGILHEVISPPKNIHNSLISRIKIISGLDIAEKRIPQDGKFSKKIKENLIDVRISTFPTIYGEKAVMRILNRSAVSFGIDKLGLDSENSTKFNSLLDNPYGIVLVTGPTGSGKTTTLYSALEKIKTKEKNIVTIEDPVEYQLKNISQSQVQPEIGLNFARLLRAIVRQDPDIILVGEIRDLETAEVAVRSALTGHLVFSTLHTNDAPGAVARLLDMGIEPFLIASSALGIIAQRLIRKICPECREEFKLKPEAANPLGIPEDSLLYRGKGCGYCFGTGYKGRLGIFEIMLVDEEIKNLITERASSEKIKKLAVKKNMRTLRSDALRKALQGQTSIEEVLRVT